MRGVAAARASSGDLPLHSPRRAACRPPGLALPRRRPRLPDHPGWRNSHPAHLPSRGKSISPSSLHLVPLPARISSQERQVWTRSASLRLDDQPRLRKGRNRSVLDFSVDPRPRRCCCPCAYTAQPGLTPRHTPPPPPTRMSFFLLKEGKPPPSFDCRFSNISRRLFFSSSTRLP